jgi:primosomal replication protein N
MKIKKIGSEIVETYIEISPEEIDVVKFILEGLIQQVESTQLLVGITPPISDKQMEAITDAIDTAMAIDSNGMFITQKNNS